MTRKRRQAAHRAGGAVVLIGMPGAGKSTVGVLLAKRLGRPFIDTDIEIQRATGEMLQTTLDRRGYLRLREIEETVICGVKPGNKVIATGGSAVYSRKAMMHLARHGTIVYLQTSLAVIRERVKDFGTRGIAARPGQGMRELFAERGKLYRRYAGVTVRCGRLTHDKAADKIIAVLHLPA